MSITYSSQAGVDGMKTSTSCKVHLITDVAKNALFNDS